MVKRKNEIGFEFGALDEVVRTIREPRTKKLLKEVCVGKEKFRKNNIYGTYNSIKTNKILEVNQLGKARKCK